MPFLFTLLSFFSATNAIGLSETERQLLLEPMSSLERLKGLPVESLTPADQLLLAQATLVTQDLQAFVAVLPLLEKPTVRGLEPSEAIYQFMQGLIREQGVVDYSGAQLRYQQALQSFDNQALPLLTLSIMKAQSYNYAVTENFAEALLTIRRMQALGQTSDDEGFALAFANESLAELYGYTSDFSLSLKHYLTALETYQALDYPARILEVELGLATTYRYSGQYPEALEYINRYIKRRASELPVVNPFFGYYTRAMILAESGDCSAAQDAIDQTLEIDGPVDFYGELFKRRAECLIASNDLEAAERSIQEAITSLFSKSAVRDTLSAAEAFYLLAEIRARQGRYQEAYRLQSDYITTREASDRTRFDLALSSMLKQSSIDQRDLDISRLKERTGQQALTIEKSRSDRLQLVWFVTLAISFAGFLLVYVFMLSRRRRQLERTRQVLREARDQANAGSQAKSQFLAHMSHEIRTPLNAIMGMTTLLLRTDLNSRQLYLGKQINIASNALMQLLNDILDLSKIESGRLTLECLDTPLMDVIDQVKGMMAVSAQSKGIEFMVDCGIELPARVTLDSLRVKQLLMNLLSNAVKFTDEGSVILTVRVIERTAESARLRFSVSDTGSGIPEARQSALFTPFTQADQSITRRFGGTGLGLAICKELVDLMDGELWLESKEGEGSTFTFEIPVPVLEWNAPLLSEFHAQLAGRRVLIVDDNAVARVVLEDDIVALGAWVSCVSSADAAYEALLKQPEDEPYDIVLMDFKMPGVNGVDACDYIVNQLQLKKPPALVLISAIGSSALRMQTEASGTIDGFISKPFTPIEMGQVLVNAILGVRESTLASHQKTLMAQQLELKPLTGVSVLLVEDNSINKEIANELLTDAGATVVLADHGGQALERLKERLCDVVLMDIQMPVMDGYQATRKIRENPAWTSLPVIAMTANVLQEDRLQALESGMNDHIGKPIDEQVLITTVAKWVGKENMGERAKAASVSNTHQLAAQDDPDMPVDLERALRSTNGNQRLLHKIFIDFYQSHQYDARTIGECIDDARADEGHRISHNLKSTAGSIGAVKLQTLATELDNALRGNDLKAADELLPDFSDELERVLQTVRDHSNRDGHTAEEGVTKRLDVGVQLGLVRRLIEEMDPAASDAAEVLLPALPANAFESGRDLLEACDGFDFSSALRVLEALETCISDGQVQTKSDSLH